MDGAVVAEGVCPYLGMVGDPNSHHSFPSRLHLCHAGEPAHIGLGFQADYCLGGLYPSCARFQRAEEAAAAGMPVAAGSGMPASAAVAGAAAASAWLWWPCYSLLPRPRASCIYQAVVGWR
jgi:hypothetical protein